MPDAVQASSSYILLTVIIMLFGGILGALCRAILDKDFESFPNGKTKTEIAWWLLNTTLPGVVAAFVVPIFLSTSESSLLKEALSGVNVAQSNFILFAFCLLASVYSRNFIDAVAQKALRTAVDAKTKAEEAKDIASEERESTSKSLADTSQTSREIEALEATNEEKAVLHALCDGEYTRRTVTGIANDTGLSKAKVKDALNTLEARKLVSEAKSKRSDSMLYQVILSGLRAK